MLEKRYISRLCGLPYTIQSENAILLGEHSMARFTLALFERSKYSFPPCSNVSACVSCVNSCTNSSKRIAVSHTP